MEENENTSIKGEDLVCPNCGTKGEIISRARVLHYAKIESINNKGGTVMWGDILDEEVLQYLPLQCDHCCFEMSVQQVLTHTKSQSQSQSQSSEETTQC